MGVALGTAYGVVSFLKNIIKNNFIISNIINFVYAVLYGLIVLLFVINFNFGEFRLFIIIACVLGTILAYKTIGKIIAKIFFYLYNKLCKGIKALTKTKLVKKVLKWKTKKQ